MWTLLLSKQADPPGTFLDRRQLDGGEIVVGRDAARCDWVLPDPAGHLSRAHCRISAVGLDLFVVDTSTNGVGLNTAGQRIAPQMPVAIRVGDRLLLGDYAIAVATEAAGMAADLQAQAIAAPPPPPPAFAQPDSWFDAPADIWGTGAPGAEVHEFLGNAMHDFLAPAASSGGGSRGMGGGGPDGGWGGPLSDAFSRPILATPAMPDPAAFAIPEDWDRGAAPAPAADPFAAPAGSRGADPFAAAPRDPFAMPAGEADPFAGFDARPPASGADPFAGFDAPAGHAPDPFGPGTGGVGGADPFAGHDPLFPPTADPFAGFEAPPAPAADRGGAGMGTDPFGQGAGGGSAGVDRFAGGAPGATPGASQMAGGDPFAGFDGAGGAPDVPAASVPAAGPPPGDPVADAAGWAAFCEGAGIDPDGLRAAPDAMRRLGVLYRQVVLGLSDLIGDRAAFKDEFRVERTRLGLGRNNPLKHLPPADSARLLLADPLPGFMDAEAAVRAAFEDVKKHQLAMLAGVQHALAAVFERLSPDEIGRIMARAAGERKGLRIGRGVNPWTVYQAVFEALRRDATSNVDSVMSTAFRDGYEAYLSGRTGRPGGGATE